MSELGAGAKDDERALWAAVLAGQRPRYAAARLSIPPARVEYLCSKWSRRGIYEWGVTHDLGWATTRDAEAQPPRTLAEASLGMAYEETGAEVWLGYREVAHAFRVPRRLLVPREKPEASRMHQDYRRRQIARRRRRRQR